MLTSWLSGKEPTCQCMRHKKHRFDSWIWRFPGGGNGNPPQYSCLENSMDIHGQKSPWWAQFMGSQRVRHDWTQTHTHTHTQSFSYRFFTFKNKLLHLFLGLFCLVITFTNDLFSGILFSNFFLIYGKATVLNSLTLCYSFSSRFS